MPERRVQEFGKNVGIDRVRVQLWDVSGNSQYQQYWGIIAKARGAMTWDIQPTLPPCL
jgi:hypothetical protein